MDLKPSFKCIFTFVLCFWQSGSGNSMNCQIGNFTQKSDVSYECQPLFTDFIEEKRSCQLFSCKKNESVSWKIIDSEKGVLQVLLKGLPKSCEFEYYDVDLEVYDEQISYDESLMCNTGNTPWKTHSKTTLENYVCSNCSNLSLDDCFQVYTVIFKYVYPSYYRLKVTPYVSGSTRQAQRSYRMHVNSTVTQYVKKKLTDLHLNASLQYRSAKRELDLGIPLVINDPPDSAKIEVKFSHNDTHLYSIKYTSENSKNIKCDEKDGLVLPSCQVQKAGLECKFSNMSQGYYSVHIRFYDDRCKKATVWANLYSDPCYWIVRKNFSVDGPIADTVAPSSESTSPEILYTCILVVILIGVIIVSFVAKKLRWRRQEVAIIGKAAENIRKTQVEQTYNFNNGHPHRFNFGQLLTLTDRPKPEVLLVYTRETAPFMELVACLRRVLDKICKCQVYDYFDAELWNEVSEDPKGWVYALIVERQAKVVIIASEVAAIRHRSLMGEFPALNYKSPHPFDHLFLYALKLLRDGTDEQSYKNHFVVTFDGFTESNHVLEYFNPYTRFVLPKHLNKLFEHLHDSDTTMHFDTSRLEERYEVRQLRLQLEHLKNLKLLAKSDVDTHKLYDW